MTIKIHNEFYKKNHKTESHFSPAHPCEIHLVYEHNHSTQVVKEMGFRDVHAERKSELLKSFENNVTPSVARKQKIQLCETRPIQKTNMN